MLGEYRERAMLRKHLRRLLISSAPTVALSCYVGIEDDHCPGGQIRIDGQCFSPQETNLTITPEGGEYRLAGGGTLYAPAGAVSKPTAIVVKLYAGANQLSNHSAASVVEFGPSGLTFDKPLQLIVPASEELEPGTLLTAVGIPDGATKIEIDPANGVDSGTNPPAAMVGPDGHHLYFHQSHFSGVVFTPFDGPQQHVEIEAVDRYGDPTGGPKNRIYIPDSIETSFLFGWGPPALGIGDPCIGALGVASIRDFDCRRSLYKKLLFHVVLQPDSSIQAEDETARAIVDAHELAADIYGYASDGAEVVAVHPFGSALVREYVLRWHKNSTFRNVRIRLGGIFDELDSVVSAMTYGIRAQQEFADFVAHQAMVAESKDRLEVLDAVFAEVGAYGDSVLRDGAFTAAWNDVKLELQAAYACDETTDLARVLCETGQFVRFMADTHDGGTLPSLASQLTLAGLKLLKEKALAKLGLTHGYLVVLDYLIGVVYDIASVDSLEVVKDEMTRALHHNALFSWPVDIELDELGDRASYPIGSTDGLNDYMSLQSQVYLAHTFSRKSAAALRQEGHTWLWKAAWKVFVESDVCWQNVEYPDGTSGYSISLCPDEEKIAVRDALAGGFDERAEQSFVIHQDMTMHMYGFETVDMAAEPLPGEEGRFLSPPLDDVVVANGWYYNFAGNGAGLTHGAIDYFAEAGTPAYAACDGVAMTSSQYADGYGYGRYVQIRCDDTDTDGQHYHLIYAHLLSHEPWIPSYAHGSATDYGNWVRVSRGDVIGHTGSDDTVWPHLHFEVNRGRYKGPAVDPYDIYAETTSASASSEQEYPPQGSRFVACGPESLWISCPNGEGGGGPGPGPTDECPNGTGYYCGESVGLDAGSLYYCSGGNFTLQEVCESGCDQMPPGVNDVCSGGGGSCPSGDGLYCGESIGLNAGTLYSCMAGMFVESQVCDEGCMVNAPGVNDQCVNSPPECASGPCCDNGAFRNAGYVCGDNFESEFGCPWGTAPGEDVGVRYRDRLCSGFSSGCDGSLGAWEAWQVQDSCGIMEVCSPGDSTCNSCSDSYSVSQYQCNNYSVADGVGGGGGEIFEICSSINSVTGMVTIHAQKDDGSTFGVRPYQVRVSDPADPPCGPNTHFFVISDSSPAGVGTSQLTFTFQSLWGAETSKAYCVTASTIPGDPGYVNNQEQTSWWHSRKSVVARQCL